MSLSIIQSLYLIVQDGQVVDARREQLETNGDEERIAKLEVILKTRPFKAVSCLWLGMITDDTFAIATHCLFSKLLCAQVENKDYQTWGVTRVDGQNQVHGNIIYRIYKYKILCNFSLKHILAFASSLLNKILCKKKNS